MAHRANETYSRNYVSFAERGSVPPQIVLLRGIISRACLSYRRATEPGKPTYYSIPELLLMTQDGIAPPRQGISNYQSVLSQFIGAVAGRGICYSSMASILYQASLLRPTGIVLVTKGE